jgi:hypothetical protein
VNSVPSGVSTASVANASQLRPQPNVSQRHRASLRSEITFSSSPFATITSPGATCCTALRKAVRMASRSE